MTSLALATAPIVSLRAQACFSNQNTEGKLSITCLGFANNNRTHTSTHKLYLPRLPVTVNQYSHQLAAIFIRRNDKKTSSVPFMT